MNKRELDEYKLKVRYLLDKVNITYLSDEQITKLAENWYKLDVHEQAYEHDKPRIIWED